MKVVVAGGCGALGRRISADLAERGYDIVVLTRTPQPAARYRQLSWDGKTPGPWGTELTGPAFDEPPPVWIQMSTLAIYGDAGDRVLDESARPSDGPAQMAGVARAWEDAAAGAPAKRLVTLRTGIVLDPASPALRRLTALVRLHATSPHPVTNAELMSALRRVLRRPPAPPTPPWLARAGALILRSDPALALTGRRCVPTALLAAGFTFGYPDLEPALHDLLANWRRQ